MTEQKKALNDNSVTVSVGAGTEPVKIEFRENDTVSSILERAGVRLEKGQTATLGRKNVKDPATTSVKIGDTIVVAGKPANG